MLSPMSPNPDLTSVLPLPGMTLSHRQREGTAVGRAARGGESWRGAVKVGCDCGTVAQGRRGRLEEARGMRESQLSSHGSVVTCQPTLSFMSAGPRKAFLTLSFPSQPPAPGPPRPSANLGQPFDSTASLDLTNNNRLYYTPCSKCFPRVVSFNPPVALPILQVWALRCREVKKLPRRTQGGIPPGF